MQSLLLWKLFHSYHTYCSMNFSWFLIYPFWDEGLTLWCLICPVSLLICDLLFHTHFFPKHWSNVFLELAIMTPRFHPIVVISPWSQVEAHYFTCEAEICFVCGSLYMCLCSKFHLLLYSPVTSTIRIFCSSSHSTLIFVTQRNSVSWPISVASVLHPLMHTLNCIPGPSSSCSDCVKVLGDGLCQVPSGSSSAPSLLQQAIPCSSWPLHSPPRRLYGNASQNPCQLFPSRS